MHYFFKYKEAVGTLIAFAILLTPTLITFAGGFDSSAGGGGFDSSAGGGFDSSVGGGNSPTANNSVGTSLQNPLKVDSFCKLVIALVNAAIIIGIPIAVLFIVWAGFKFVLARGKPEGLAEARKNFVAVIIGIAIFVGASLIANVIVNTLRQLGVQGINSC